MTGRLRRHGILLVAAAASALILASRPAAAQGESIAPSSLVAAFLERDPAVAAARSELAAAKSAARLRLASSAGPSISAQASASGGSVGLGLLGPTYDGNLSLGFDLSASFPLGKGPLRDLALAEEGVEEARYRLVELDRAASFLEACVDLVEARLRAGIEASKLEAFKSLLDEAEAARKAGAGTATEVLAARQALSSARADLHDLDTDLEAKEAAVTDLLGERLPPGVGFESLAIGLTGDFDAGLWAARASAELGQARAAREAGREPLVRGLGISLSSRLSPLAPSTGGSVLGLTAGATLSLSPPQAGAAAAATDRFEADRARTGLELAARRLEAGRAVDAVERAGGRIPFFRESADDAARYLEAVQASKEAGVSTLEDVLAARSTLRSRSLALLSAEATLARAKVGLVRKLGLPGGGGR